MRGKFGAIILTEKQDAWLIKHFKHTKNEEIAEKLELLGKRDGSQNNQSQQQAPVQQTYSQQQQPQHYTQPIPPAGDPQDGDLPFDHEAHRLRNCQVNETC